MRLNVKQPGEHDWPRIDPNDYCPAVPLDDSKWPCSGQGGCWVDPEGKVLPVSPYCHETLACEIGDGSYYSLFRAGYARVSGYLDRNKGLMASIDIEAKPTRKTLRGIQGVIRAIYSYGGACTGLYGQALGFEVENVFATHDEPIDQTTAHRWVGHIIAKLPRENAS